MENRTARLTLLIDPAKKQIFEEVCTMRDMTPSQVVRQMIRDYVQQYGTPEQIARMPLILKMNDIKN
ncbi:MAG: CopG family transcriptional regulator [Gallionella sp.]|nr:CopG family transcriptional regulator [Gallionella sp.]